MSEELLWLGQSAAGRLTAGSAAAEPQLQEAASCATDSASAVVECVLGCLAADLPLQPSRPGEPWQAPPHSSGTGGRLKAGCALTLQLGSDEQHQQQQQPQEVWLQCVDSHGWVIGCLLQQELVEALEFAGHPHPLQQPLDWQHWRAVVRSIKRGPGDDQLAAVLVRLLPAAEQ